jgi:DNA-binding winged helix-turn-helix (wHTH) protein
VRVRCGDWVIDSGTRQVTRGRGVVHLSPKAFELLLTLVRERPRALSKVELQDRLWPDTFVTEASLAGLVREVRSALGDGVRRPKYIRTVHRFGYAFSGKATEEPPTPTTPARGPAVSARLVLGTRDIALPPGEHMLGRTEEAMVWIDSVSVSRCHARISVTDAGVSLEDLGSKNGTFVNGTRVCRPHRLEDGDQLRLGSVRMVFRAFAPPPTTETDLSGRARVRRAAGR